MRGLPPHVLGAPSEKRMGEQGDRGTRRCTWRRPRHDGGDCNGGWRRQLEKVIIVAKVGAAEKPLITFNPDWQEIFRTESMRMICNMRTSHPGDTIYTWYKDKIRIHGQTYRIMEVNQIGNYQCKGSNTDISDPVKLHVSDEFVILQAPLYIHEGDNLTLRCHHYPGYTARSSQFYKGSTIIRGWGSDSELRFKNITLKTSGRYSCLKNVGRDHEGDVMVSVHELFTAPKISPTSDLVAEGDSMTLECQTNVSPFKLVADLLFAFYRDGEMVQTFASSAQYEVRHAQLEHSGKYHCDVKTTNDRVMKSSQALHMKIVEYFTTPEVRVLAAKGESMTLACHTNISSLKLAADVCFAFYKDGKLVQGFGSSDLYEVQSAQLEHSGKYHCDVKTTNDRVIKRSQAMDIGITEPEESTAKQNIARLVLSGCLLILASVFICYHVKFIKSLQTGARRPTSPQM